MYISPLDWRRRLWLFSAPGDGAETIWHGTGGRGEEGPRNNATRRWPYIPAFFAGMPGAQATARQGWRDRSGRCKPGVLRQGGDSFAGSVHDSPPRQGDARGSHKQEKNRKNRKNNNSNKHSNHRNITSGKNIPDTSQTGRVTGDAPASPASLPAGVSLPGV
ncbi:hypothetical protein ACQ93J_26415, partial [Escherichia coli]